MYSLKRSRAVLVGLIWRPRPSSSARISSPRPASRLAASAIHGSPGRIGDPEQDAPVLGVQERLSPTTSSSEQIHASEVCRPARYPRSRPRARAPCRPGLVLATHDHEGRLPADHPGGCRRDLVLALLGRARAPEFLIFSASALTPMPSSFAAARSADHAPPRRRAPRSSGPRPRPIALPAQRHLSACAARRAHGRRHSHRHP